MKNWLILLITLPLFSSAQIGLDLESGNPPDYIDCGNHASISITGTSITLEAWVKPESFAGAIWGGNIINKSGAGDQGYMIRIGGTGQVNFNIGSGSWTEITSPTNTVTLGNWCHVAATYDGVNMRLYVDGVEVASNSFSSNIGSASNNLLLGDDPGNLGRNYDGVIEEVKIWNVARSAAEVLSDMHPLVCLPHPTGLVAYYKFNEGVDGANNSGLNAANNIIDEIGNNTGSLLNSSYNGPSSNWVTGRPDPVADASFTLSATDCNSAGAIITGASGGVFAWNPDLGDGSVLNTGTGSITGGTPGETYTIDYTVCGLTTTESITLPSSGNPSFTTSVQCGGGTATVTGDLGGIFSFNPLPGDGTQINSSTGTVTIATAGTTYSVEYTICGSSSIESVTVLDDNCWTLNGDAQYVTIGGEQCIQLTSETTDLTGCSWNGSQIDFASDFTLSLDYYFGNNINGADGNTFTFQPGNSTSCGQTGAQLGAGGLANALSIEFDTYDNDNPTHLYDMVCDHIAVEIDGNMQGAAPFAGPVCAKAGGGNIDDGGTYTVDIQWDAATQQLDIYFNGVLRLTTTHDFVANVFGGQSEVYWGATSATGGLTNLQYFCPSTVTILPIELGDFYTVCSEKEEKIVWTTITENRVDYFVVEYTYDGIAFQPAGMIDAVGESQEILEYQFNVKDANTKQKYYRLKIIDIDGAFEYTDIIASKNCTKELIQTIIQKDDQLLITTSSESEITLINPTGQQIVQCSTLNNQCSISKMNLSTGIYLLTVSNSDEVLVKKIFIY